MPTKKTTKKTKAISKKTKPSATRTTKKKKTAAKKPAPKKDVKTSDSATKKQPVQKKSTSFIHAVGRRKSSVARVRFYPNESQEIIVNDKPYDKYLQYFELQKIVRQPLDLLEMREKGKFTIKVSGGGFRGQAESIRLGISKALLQHEPDLKPQLKSHKLLRTDSRVKERKKYGLKKARRAPQWAKR